MRIAGAAVALAIVFALVLSSGDPLDLLIGGAVGAALVAVLGRRMPKGPRGPVPPLGERLLWSVPLAGAVLADVARGTWDVALRVVHLRPLERPGLIKVPVGSRSPRGVAVSALVTTLSPGSVLIDVDWDRGELLLHLIDVSDPDAERARFQRFYDRYQRRVFP